MSFMNMNEWHSDIILLLINWSIEGLNKRRPKRGQITEIWLTFHLQETCFYIISLFSLFNSTCLYYFLWAIWNVLLCWTCMARMCVDLFFLAIFLYTYPTYVLVGLFHKESHAIKRHYESSTCMPPINLIYVPHYDKTVQLILFIK